MLRILLIVAVGVAASACAPAPKSPEAAGPSGTVATAVPTPAKPALPDPPLTFDRDGISLGEPADGQFVVHGVTAYYMRDDASATDIPSLVATDLLVGRPLWSKPLATDAVPGRWAPLRMVTVDGKARVLITYLARLKGSGTQGDRELLRVIAVDAGDGTRLWTVDLDDDRMPGGPQTRFNAYAPPTMVAADNEHLVIGADDSVVVLDARNGNQRWSAAGFRPGALEGGVIVGLAGGKANARAAVDGKPAWTGGDLADRVQPLGSGLVALTAGAATKLVEAKTGAVKATLAGGLDCRHDLDSLVVCWNGTSLLVSVDAANGRTLWQLPDNSADRIIPRVSSVRRGMIYGTAGVNGPVIVDARTGRDRMANVAVSPALVIPGFGLVLSDRGGLFAHKAL